MVSIRRGGGVVAFFWQGSLPDPQQPEFVKALAKQRFRTIENAASEETSVGWVTAPDPTGASFALQDMDGGPASWMRMRIDTKKMPAKWLQIHRISAEKAAGRKLSARERRELRDDLVDKLLPRVLPAVNFVDALLFHDRKILLLLSTSTSASEQFHKLFFESFKVPLDRCNPLPLGLRRGIGCDSIARLEGADPIRWPQQRPARRIDTIRPSSDQHDHTDHTYHTDNTDNTDNQPAEEAQV